MIGVIQPDAEDLGWAPHGREDVDGLGIDWNAVGQPLDGLVKTTSAERQQRIECSRKAGAAGCDSSPFTPRRQCGQSTSSAAAKCHESQPTAPWARSLNRRLRAPQAQGLLGGAVRKAEDDRVLLRPVRHGHPMTARRKYRAATDRAVRDSRAPARDAPPLWPSAAVPLRATGRAVPRIAVEFSRSPDISYFQNWRSTRGSKRASAGAQAEDIAPRSAG